MFAFPEDRAVRTFTGAGHTIEVNTTVPLSDVKVIAGALLGPDGAVKQSITFPRSPVPDTYSGQWGPTVASDGSGFLVAYESNAFWRTIRRASHRSWCRHSTRSAIR